MTTIDERAAALRADIVSQATLEEVLANLPLGILERIGAGLNLLEPELANLPESDLIRAALHEHVDQISDEQIQNVIDAIQAQVTRHKFSTDTGAIAVKKAESHAIRPTSALIAAVIYRIISRDKLDTTSPAR